MTRNQLALSMMVMTLAGCGATTPTVLDRQMGQSVNTAVAQQTMNPRAAQDARPVEKIDGKSAAALMDRYHKGFEKPTTVNIFNMDVGGNTGNTLGTSTNVR